MTTLHERLADLAEDAPASPPAPGLWERGVRYRRLRRTGTLTIVAAACLALVALMGVSWQRAGGLPQPASSPSGQPGLPDRLWSPSPWLRGTDEAGPLGALSAVLWAERGSWTGTQQAPVGVSATTGEYAFLDLPDRAIGDVALSPDGRKVAYWVTGGTSGSPREEEGGPVVGVAVYDATNGDVRRADVPTEHGLAPDALVWADDGQLVLSYGQWRGGRGDDEMDQSSSTLDEPFLWRLDRARPVPLPVPKGADDASVVGGGQGRVVLSDSRRYWSYYLDNVSFGWPMLGRADLTLSTEPVFGTSFRFAAVRGTRNPGPLVVGEATAHGGVRTSAVPGAADTRRVLAWNGPDQLVVERSPVAAGRVDVDASVSLVDVDTGRTEELVRLPAAGAVGQVQLASDLYDDPTVAGREPPSPADPRGIAAVGGLTALAGAVGVVLWRRRVQP